MFWVWAIARFALPRLGWRQSVLAAGIAGTSLGVLAMGRAATADALLNLFIALSLFDLWRCLEQLSIDPQSTPLTPLRRAYLWIGLGLLTKGPVAALIPGMVTLLYCLSNGTWRSAWRLCADPASWVICVCVFLPWYGAEYVRHGQAFIDGFFIKHNLNRFHGTLEGHRGSMFYYVLMAPLLLLPWSGLIWNTLRRTRAFWMAPLHRFLLIWFGFVLVFFSFSGTKLPHYLMYGLTPVFLLLATSLQQSHGTRAWLAMPIALLMTLPALPWGIATWAAAHAARLPAPYVAQAAQAGSLAWHDGYYLVCGLTVVAGLWATFANGRAWWTRALMVSTLVGVSVLYGLTPWLGEVLQGPVKTAALLARNNPRPAVQWNYSAPSFSVYREQITPARPPLPGELAITRLDRLPGDMSIEILYQSGGIALVQRAMTP
jgi:4-amino-4-deoxy-L-arabinose transferase-like glycosyltransferase